MGVLPEAKQQVQPNEEAEKADEQGRLGKNRAQDQKLDGTQARLNTRTERNVTYVGLITKE
jgi:hypothetical protein